MKSWVTFQGQLRARLLGIICIEGFLLFVLYTEANCLLSAVPTALIAQRLRRQWQKASPTTTLLPLHLQASRTRPESSLESVETAPKDDSEEVVMQGAKKGQGGVNAAAKKKKIHVRTTVKRMFRTHPYRITFKEECDSYIYYCLKAYDTGKVCGRAMNFTYHDFPNMCSMDYVNCRENYEVWSPVHMGLCYHALPLSEDYKYYDWKKDFLNDYYAHID